MRMLRSLQGLPVICGKRRVGRLLQADIGEDLVTLEGIWFSAGWRGTRYIPAERLQLIGEAAILADDAGERKRLRATPIFRRAVSTEGRRLGAITDALIDELTLRVRALELSAGVWDDLLRGRRHISQYTVKPDSGEVVVNPDDGGKEVREDEGSYQGNDHRHGSGRGGCDDVRRDELADGAPLEPEGEADRQLDRG